MILIITYDLRGLKDYHDFYEAVKGQGKWWRYMTSSWILSTDKSPSEVCDAIKPHMEPLDSLFVCELKANYQGWLPKPAWDWLNEELAKPSALEALIGPMAAHPTPIIPDDLMKRILSGKK